VTTVHVVVPEGIDDPLRRSGGNVYDRHLCDGLAAAGWSVSRHEVPGFWPTDPPVPTSGRASLAGVLTALDDDAVVLLDGLVASSAPEVLVPQASRLRLVVLVHLPLGVATEGVEALRQSESAVLSASAAVVTTSTWTRNWLLQTYGLPTAQVQVAEPGVEPAAPVAGSPQGRELLCVAAVAPHKGHDTLLAALAAVADLPWRCVCVGSLTRAVGFVDALDRDAAARGLSDRFVLAGHSNSADMARGSERADVLVLASRTETYGMVVTEALAHGLPVVATEVGGVPDALGYDAEGRRPGLLVPADDATALAAALRRWLEDGDVRHRLRHSARQRRELLPTWADTSAQVSRVLAEVAS
jgi:glycosyltransferase involved in cell wall biosynthesis